MTNKLYIKILMLIIVVFSFSKLWSQDQNNFELSKNLEIYADILRQLNLNYADDIKPGELSTTAIDAMLAKLDPYTVYVPESRREDFELMTRGEYGGIGALIQKQGEYVVITEPYEKFPAQELGLKAGDMIYAINGESAMGKSSPEVSEKLKGTPGTSIILTIKSYGDSVTHDIELIRKRIKIPNIPFYGMVSNNIGYINLTQFNPQSAIEVKTAFNNLVSENDLKGIILDLRGNGGGLLNEAVDIVNIFVPKNKIIVTTKGKMSNNTFVHRTRTSGVDTKIPLVVLVNGFSASASEIVAGAIQDLDRGVIIGDKTFGKGLVQNILELPYNSKMKLTVAKYYIPSGRCIQAIDYFDNIDVDSLSKLPDSLLQAFSTSGGRAVYDKGGIEPDIAIDGRNYSQISGDLYSQNYLFKFANDFVLKHDSIPSAKDFTITDSVFNDFERYVEDQGFDYKTETEVLLENIRKSSEREDYLDAMDETLTKLADEITIEKKKDIDKNRTEIEEMLKIEIVTRYYYQQGKIESSLVNDPEIIEAIKVINNKSLYSSILNGSYNKQ
ncbi:MAG: peptidase S41 [Bacteroidetes bacterium]|jgi:carboxyl-terminal processing protease|nr:peptidase S41 [Bacteroidota bacterium]